MKLLVILAVCIVGALAHCDKAPFIKASWEQVKHNEVDILYTIFKDYPEIQERFPKFVGKDLEELKGTPDFAIHATRIVSFLSEIISLTGNPSAMDAVNTLLTEMANNHKNRGISKELISKFDLGLKKYISTHSTWNAETQEAWRVVLKDYNKIIFEILDH